MLRVFSERLKVILGSSAPWVFLFGVIALGLFTNGLSTAITALVDKENSCGGWITTVSGFVLLGILLFFFDLPGVILRLFKHPELRTSEPVARRRGLVSLVSPGPGGSFQTRDAMGYHLGKAEDPSHLEYCWLICGPADGLGSNTSEENAKSIKEEFEAQGVSVQIEKLNSSEDPKGVYTTVLKIYQEAKTKHGLTPDQIVSDFTAGTKSMTFGMTLACADQGWPLQFMRVLRDKDLDARRRARDGAKGTPVLVNIDFFSRKEREIAG